ncbi:uncharacterized protein LOC134230028 [Saccostrea cucullata]|uniref:uncharacterized protein LOC134230028 n=1 Tax=Saccostrea cuccullata TaxID=36930 RepID=UPI002ED3119A
MKFQLSVAVFLIWQFVLFELFIQPANGNWGVSSDYKEEKKVTLKVDKDGNITLKIEPAKKRRCINCKGEMCTFTQFDSNKDGFISLEEFLEKAGAYRYKKLFKIAFRLVDTNADGRISQEEFKKLKITLPYC